MKDLVEKKNDLITRAEAVINTAKAEKRELTEAEAAEIAEIRDNVRRIVRHLELVDDIDELDRMGRKGEGEKVMEKETTKEAEETRAIEIQEREAFENFIRGYVVHQRAGELTPTPYDSSTTTTGGAGGKLIPTTMSITLLKKSMIFLRSLKDHRNLMSKGICQYLSILLIQIKSMLHIRQSFHRWHPLLVHSIQ